MAVGYAYKGNERFINNVADRLVAAGFAATTEPGAADIVITYCTTQTELEELYFGDGGFISELAPHTVLVDLSPTTPGFARELNAVATVSDLEMVEAPLMVADMTRPDTFAQDNLQCFAAGEGQGLERAQGILDAIFSSVVPLGSPGAAQLARAAYTMQVVAQVVAAIEADALFRAVRRSVAGAGSADAQPGVLSSMGAAILDAVRENRFEGAYTVEMLMGELTAVLMAADDNEVILPQTESAMHLLELLAVIGGVEKAPAALALVYGEEADCAAAGLDWSRAEQAYASSEEEEEEWGRDEEDDDFFEGLDDGFGYSVN